MKSSKKTISDEFNTSFNIYLPKEQKELIREESKKRGLTISAFLRIAAYEKINRERFVSA